MKWLVAGVSVAVVCALVYWWIRRRRRSRLISFVALVREPMTFDPAVLARLAGRAWNADLGDGTSEGADGFVACSGQVNMIRHDGRFFLINSFPRPYVDDAQAWAKRIADLRISSGVREHQAWFSFDALGVDGTTSEGEVLAWYQRLGKLLAEFLDENCLLIFVPDPGRAYPINKDTMTALRSDDPLKTLQETLTLPIIEVSVDDPLIQQAVEEARRDWHQFLAAYETGAGKDFSVKAPLTHEGNTEFIWITVTALEGDRVYGTLGNDPGNLGPLKFGSKVSVAVTDLNDWCYFDPSGKLAGGYTVEAILKASQQRAKKGTTGTS
jgi:uncharacterized protein YegJ (DUF2314 family)